LQLLECAEVSAVVRPVNADDFRPEVLRQRLRRPEDLECLVRGHNRVIETIHARHAILPAKMGMVYADAHDLESALTEACGRLLPHLARLDGCDEWGVHLHVDGKALRHRIATEDNDIRRLRTERATARPGRAYFLEQRVAAELDAALARVTCAAAHRAFERLSGVAVAAHAAPPAPTTNGEVEILNASFLVKREEEVRFEETLYDTADADNLRFKVSGPWPPYSFAMHDMEDVA
jgi:hypothetical protein